MHAQSRRVAVRHRKVPPANDAICPPDRPRPNSLRRFFLSLSARSLLEAAHFPALSVQATESNLGKRNPSSRCAGGPAQPNRPPSAGGLRVLPSQLHPALIPHACHG